MTTFATGLGFAFMAVGGLLLLALAVWGAVEVWWRYFENYKRLAEFIRWKRDNPEETP